MRLSRLSGESGAALVTIPKPSASTDTLAQINDAITAVYNAGGGVVQLAAGTYIVNGTILMKENVALVGAGKYATIIKEADTGAMTKVSKSDLSSTWQTSHTAASSFPMYPVISVELGGSRKKGIRVEALTVDCNGANQADTPSNAGNSDARSYCGIFRTNADGFVTKDVFVKDAGLSLAGDVATTGCRAYCFFTADAINCIDYSPTGDNSRYDVWGARGYSSGTVFDGDMGSTTGTNCRASWQVAYQCQVRDKGWTFIRCRGVNTNASVTSANGFMSHGTRAVTIIDCYFEAVAGHAFYDFGDNTNGADDSPLDQYNTLPSLTNDEWTDRLEITSMRCLSSGAVPTVNIDTQFSRDIHIGSLWARHLTGDSPCVQLNGGTGKTRRFVADHIHATVDSVKNTCIYLNNVRNSHIRDAVCVFTGDINTTGSVGPNGLYLNGCSDVMVDRFDLHVTCAASMTINAGILMNSCVNCKVDRAEWFSNIAVTVSFGMYIENNCTHCHINNVGTDISGLITFTSSRIVHFPTSRGAGCKLFDCRACHTFEQGTDTITAGLTTKAVTFATAAYVGTSSWNTPAAKHIQITSNSAMGTGLNIWVTSVTASGFTANIAAAAAANIDFAYTLDTQHN